MNKTKVFFTKSIRIAWILTLLTFLITNAITFFVFDHIPHIHDSITQLFQAKIFLAGNLYFPSPPSKQYFDYPHMINNGKWYSQYSPGYPFILLLALVIGMTWIVNPFFGSLSVFIFYLLGKELFNEKVGLLAALLGCVSPFLLFMSSNFMSHTTCMFFFSFFLLFFFRSLKKPSVINGIFSGGSLGICFLIRPFTAICLAFPFLVYYGFKAMKALKRMRKNVVAFLVVAMISVSILLIYNYVTNGHPLTMGYIVCHGKGHGLGFEKSGWGPPHTPFLGAINTWNYIKYLNTYLFEWPFSSLFGLFALFISYKSFNITKADKKIDLLLFSGFIFLLLGYFFYWWEFNLFGPRMIFEALPILLILSARGIMRIPCFISYHFKKVRPTDVKRVIAGVLVLFVLYALVVRIPLRIKGKTDWYFDGYGKDFAGVTPRIHNTIRALKIKDAVVLIKMLYKPFRYFPSGWWDSGFLYNSPKLDTQVIYARDLGEKVPALVKDYPKRKFYLYLGTLEKGMLLPLIFKEQSVIYEEPLVKEFKANKYIQLLKRPAEFFEIEESAWPIDVWNELKKNDIYRSIDVLSLSAVGTSHKKQNDYEKAAIYFELALQIEKNPEERFFLLNELLPCYYKLGRREDAKELSKELNEFNTRQH